MTADRARRWPLVAGLAGLMLSALGWLLAPAQFPYAWLAAFVAWSAWPLGSVALLLIHSLTGGRWGEAVRPGLLAGASTLPLMLLGVLPLILTATVLYPWLRPGAEVPGRWYLNGGFAAGRGAAYLLIWFGLAALARRRRGGGAAALGLLLLGTSLTFAAIDTTMSLDPKFSSSIYGMVAAAQAALLALSAALLLGARTAEEAVLADLGRLLLGLVALWAYLDFMQLLIVWQSDLRAEVPWYLHRTGGGWGWVLAVLAAGHVALPVGLLMSPRLRRSRAVLGGVATLLVAMEALRAWWIVLPAVPRNVGWVDLACMLAFMGLSAAMALRARPLRHA